METSAYFAKFMSCQIKKINLEINDLQDDSLILNWIDKNSSTFRHSWECSLCKQCINSDICGWKVLNNCEFYKN